MKNRIKRHCITPFILNYRLAQNLIFMMGYLHDGLFSEICAAAFIMPYLRCKHSEQMKSDYWNSILLLNLDDIYCKDKRDLVPDKFIF